MLAAFAAAAACAGFKLGLAQNMVDFVSHRMFSVDVKPIIEWDIFLDLLIVAGPIYKH